MSKVPQSSLQVLEDGTAALVESPAEDAADASVQYASLDELKPEEAADPAKAPAKVPAKVDADPAPAAAEEELPADLKGKTPAQLAKMYQDAQRLIGRQGSELGDLRQRVDFAIQTNLAAIAERRRAPAAPAADAAAAAPSAPVVEESEFFAKPGEAVSKMIENHPLIKEIRSSLGKTAADTETQRATAATQRFNQAHPDAADILRDPEFRAWVGASKVRRELMHRAHTSFDFDSGDEVFSTWKALKGVRRPAAAGAPDAAAAAVSEAARTLAAAKAAKTTQAAQAAAAAAAAVPTGGASAGKAAGSKKIFRRADVLKLMEENPERYEALADEIGRAYAEGRVR